MENLRNTCKKRVAAFTLAALVLSVPPASNAGNRSSQRARTCITGSSVAQFITQMPYMLGSAARRSAGNFRHAVGTSPAWQATLGFVVDSVKDLVARTPLADVGVGAIEAKQRIFLIQKAYQDANDAVSGATKTVLPSSIE